LDQLRLEIAAVVPLPLIPLLKVNDGASTNLTLQQLPVVERNIGAWFGVAEPADGIRRFPVFHLPWVEENFVCEVQLPVAGQARRGKVRRSENRQDRAKAVEEHLLSRPVGIEKPTLGMKKPLFIQPHLHGGSLQVGN